MDCNSSRGVIAACGGEAHEQSRSRVGRLGSRIGEQGAAHQPERARRLRCGFLFAILGTAAATYRAD